MSFRFTENYPEVAASFSMEITQVLYRGKSPYQKIAVVDTLHFGKVLLIDDMVMLTEKDEFIYHEMIAHVPLYVHPHPAEVLVIGGGDGGTARELLKHPEISHIDLVDIDRQVSQVCLEFLPAVAGKLLSERVNCRYEDGVAYVKNTDRKYDVIIIDSTDPVSVGEGLFTREFYGNCFQILKKDGLLVNQAESPQFTPGWVEKISRKLKAVFPRLFFYQANIPTYPSGHWLFGFASKKFHPVKDFQEKRFQTNGLTLKYYNREIHTAAFSLPNFIRDIVDGA